MNFVVLVGESPGNPRKALTHAAARSRERLRPMQPGKQGVVAEEPPIPPDHGQSWLPANGTPGTAHLAGPSLDLPLLSPMADPSSSPEDGGPIPIVVHLLIQPCGVPAGTGPVVTPSRRHLFPGLGRTSQWVLKSVFPKVSMNQFNG